jgi:steroid delta-isomerase-like uncharacterized protein
MATTPTETSPFLRKLLDVYNSRRPEEFDTLFTEDCVLVRNGVEARGRPAVKEVLAKLYRAFPDIEYEIEDAVVAGDKTAIRWRGHGTHRGEYVGIPPTGLDVDYDGMTMFEVRGDKIARLWVSADMLGLARRLGARAAAGEQPALHA